MRAQNFIFRPSPPFRLDLTAWVLRRVSRNAIDRWDGSSYRRLLVAGGKPVELIVSQRGSTASPELAVQVRGEVLPRNSRRMGSEFLDRVMGIHRDLSRFYTVAKREPGLGMLIRRFRGVKPVRFPSVYEAAVNGIVCQQISLDAALATLNRICASFGKALISDGMEVHAFPGPEDMQGLSVEDLRNTGLSRSKAAALIELSSRVVSGALDLESLGNLSNERAAEVLQELPGVGPWTSGYVLLRGLGRLGVFPRDDRGAQNKLQGLLRLKERPDNRGVDRALEAWRPYAGLIYFHLLLDHLASQGHVFPNEAP